MRIALASSLAFVLAACASAGPAKPPQVAKVKGKEFQPVQPVRVDRKPKMPGPYSTVQELRQEGGSRNR